MKKKLLALAVTTTLTFSIALPYASLAGSDDVKALREQVKEKQEKQKQLKAQLKENEQKQDKAKAKLNQLDESLEKIQAKISHLYSKIAKTENELDKAKKKLAKAEKRVAERDKLLKDRVRLLYEKGRVSYLEVLLGAKDFGDFLARFESIQTIADQDKTLLLEQKRDRDVIAKAKGDIESSLKELNTLQDEAQHQRSLLAEKQKEQQVALAGLQREHSHLEEMNEAAADKERELAAKLAAKLEEQQPKSSIASYAAFKDSGGTLAWPVHGRLSSGFGPRGGRMHKGIDIAAPIGTPIYAAADGTVTAAGPSSGYGNRITVSHGGGLSTLYGHMFSNGILVKPGQHVKRGDLIGRVGNAGRSTGPHCHFEVLRGSTPVNPMGYLN